MWDNYLGEQAKAIMSFMTGATYIIEPNSHGYHKIGMGGMDVTNYGWLFESNWTNKSEDAK